MRRIAFVPCERAALAATFDGPAEATEGWVFVVGGTQTRVGPHRLYERLAARLGEAGQAVIRFDRRGVGDSPGVDGGYLASAPDIAAAAAALRKEFPKLTRVSGFGLCDGATALALHGRAAGIDRLVAANPWVVEPSDDLPPAAAIRGYYARRLLDPAAWGKMLRGGVNLGRLARGVARSATRDDAGLAERFARGVPADTRIVLADGDGTAQAFAGAWRQVAGAPTVEILRVASASHSFAGAADFEALFGAIPLTSPPVRTERSRRA
jgi:exosortase A-associated hydrolase 1